jgi:hypothetical protein
MDHAPFALKQHLLVLHQAGIRHLLPASEAVPVPSLLSKEPWKGLLAKLPPGASSLWTYDALGQDFTAEPSSARRDILRRLINQLNLPKGFVGFFPFTLPAKDAQQPTQPFYDHFLEALCRVAPASVVIFSDDSCHALSPSIVDHAKEQGMQIAVRCVGSLESFMKCTDSDFTARAASLKALLFQDT